MAGRGQFPGEDRVELVLVGADLGVRRVPGIREGELRRRVPAAVEARPLGDRRQLVEDGEQPLPRVVPGGRPARGVRSRSFPDAWPFRGNP